MPESLNQQKPHSASSRSPERDGAPYSASWLSLLIATLFVGLSTGVGIAIALMTAPEDYFEAGEWVGRGGLLGFVGAGVAITIFETFRFNRITLRKDSASTRH